MTHAMTTAPFPSRRPLRSRLLWPAVDPRTFLRAAHLGLMFPLGLGYFVFLVTTVSVGGALVWTFVGPPILLATVFICRWLADVEALLVRFVSGQPLRRPPFRLEGVPSFRERIKLRLIDPTTWTGIAYLLLQFPIGVAAFIALVVGGAVAGSLIAAPAIVLFSGELSLFDGTSREWVMETPLEALALVPVGLVLWLLVAHVIQGASKLHTTWARFMLASRARSVPSSPVIDPPQPPPSPGTPMDEAVVSEPESRVAPVLAPVETITAALEMGAAADVRWNYAGLRDLTPREREVLLFLASGYSNAEIAEAFLVSEGTVKTHVKRVLSKLEVRDRTQAAILAYQHGLVGVQAQAR